MSDYIVLDTQKLLKTPKSRIKILAPWWLAVEIGA